MSGRLEKFILLRELPRILVARDKHSEYIFGVQPTLELLQPMFDRRIVDGIAPEQIAVERLNEALPLGNCRIIDCGIIQHHCPV
jgi:hypothetical protein